MLPDCEVDEDGYPDEKFLDALRAHKFEPSEAARFVAETFPAICEQIPCCSCDVTDEADEISGAPLKRVRFTTGGWSGAEDLIDAMLRHFWVGHLHTLWRRGGLYVFDVPAKLLA